MSRPQNVCYIYVFGQKDGQYVKFGKTRNPAEVRMQQHEARGPDVVEMVPLAIMWGHDSDEKAIKHHWCYLLRERKTKTEWLKPDLAFREWLRFLRSQAFVARSFDEMDALHYVDSRHWLPGGASRIEDRQGRLRFNNDPWADLDSEEEIGDGDYYTNATVIAAARHAMGGIDLDPASCRMANTVVKATRFFTAQQDGLAQHWNGRIWLNPPFGQWDFWASKVVSEVKSGRVDQACVLAPSRASTAKQFHIVVQSCDAIFLPNGRLPFWGPKTKGGPDEGHLIFYFGRQIQSFAEAFGALGTAFVSPMSRNMKEHSA